MKMNLAVAFDVFDTANDNNLITTESTLDDAIQVAQTNPNYAVDLMIGLQDDDGAPLNPDGDYVFYMQVYPTVKEYNNIETKIEIKE